MQEQCLLYFHPLPSPAIASLPNGGIVSLAVELEMRDASSDKIAEAYRAIHLLGAPRPDFSYSDENAGGVKIQESGFMNGHIYIHALNLFSV